MITLKGIKALQRADCVFYDYLVDPSLLEHAPQAEHVYAGKRKGDHSLPQDELSRMLKEKSFAGKNVVRLKGGDPLIFGRGADEIQYLRAYHIDVTVIPGISSATGIPSSLGIPLTARGVSSSVAFLTGHEEDENKKNTPQPIAIPKADTLVFLMGLTKLSVIIDSLVKTGWPQETPAMIIANGTKIEEQIVKGTLSNIQQLSKIEGIKPPALIIVGNTLNLYKHHNKQTYLHCGTHPELYGQLGRIIHWPMITITPILLSELQQNELQQTLNESDIIICTSPYAAENFCLQFSTKELKHKIFAVIGRQTLKALEQHGITAGIIATEETAEGLYKAIIKHLNVTGKQVFFPRSSLPNPFLKEALIAKGAKVTEIAIYTNTKHIKRDLPPAKIDGVIFTSPSTVRNFLADYATIPPTWEILAKGPVTYKTLHESGYTYATPLS